MEILSMEKVKKSFGSLPVLRDLSFSVPECSVFGFIGKNGAGKTTTMKMLLGFLKPDAGEIRICGEKVRYGNTKTNRHIGYLPDVPEYYGYMTPSEYLRLCGDIAGMPPRRTRARAAELLPLVGLETKRKIRGFSRGMKQRLGIAQALLSEPRLLVCDEPTSALDPVGRKEIQDILSVARQRTTIIFSTHILSDVERICDHVGILDGGKLALEGKLSDLKDSYRHETIRVEFAVADGCVLSEKIKGLPFAQVTEVLENAMMIRLSNARTEGRVILEHLLEERISILKYEVLEPTLEDVFLEAIR
jgi:ABC-2 type transport system ATP-binding protein